MKIGIDIGGSHIGVGLVNEEGKIILKKEKDLLKSEQIDMKKFITETIIQFINEIVEKQKINIEKIKFIGIAYPAKIHNGKMEKAVNLGIHGEEIKEIIKEHFCIPVYIKNDAKCAAICEKKYGSLKQYSNAIFLTIGTGIGGAVFINGTLINSEKNDMFEIGHMTIQKDGIKCNCGRKGCFEKYSSITSLKVQVTEKFKISRSLTGVELYDFIIDNYRKLDMQKIIDTYIDDLSVGLLNLINLLQPEAISIGGSFAYYQDIFLEKLETKLKESAIKFNEICPKILIATNKNNAGIIGAANIK